MKRILKIYMERPELVALVVLVALVACTSRSPPRAACSCRRRTCAGILNLFPLSWRSWRSRFGLLMIAGEFDLSIGSMFGLTPMVRLCLLS